MAITEDLEVREKTLGRSMESLDEMVDYLETGTIEDGLVEYRLEIDSEALYDPEMDRFYPLVKAKLEDSQANVMFSIDEEKAVDILEGELGEEDLAIERIGHNLPRTELTYALGKSY